MSDHDWMEHLANLAESSDLECKAAQGRDGHGELPEDFWRSYSAMANTEGGVILLGIQEKPRGQFRVLGLADLERVRKALWDNLNNRKQVSANLLSEADVQPITADGKRILRVQVPRAARHAKPVHLGSNPFGGTYLRRHESDYQADDETVRRMTAERVEDSRDERVLKGFDFTDLDLETVAAYRNRFAAVKPGHVWSDLPLPEFMERIGAFGKNREEGRSGIRLAGLLMFGRAEVIRDELPHYMVDYQERPEPKAEKRWVDRLVPDGTWSGNIYDFFRRVYQKLTVDLKVPFQLQDGQRIEDTPVHEALREALVNTLIHADFTGRVSLLVVKRPDMFGFRNPGLMRIPPEQAVLGGDSDCRNRRLQTMFQLVGYGDHAGSGIPKIYHNWDRQRWRRPMLYEHDQPEQTLMELRMTSLVPPEVVADLENHIGNNFRQLSELEQTALITAKTEGLVNHARLREISVEHSADITKMLGGLVRMGLLVSEGVRRGMVYYLPWDSTHESFAQVVTLPTLAQESGAQAQEFNLPKWIEISDIPAAELGRLKEIAATKAHWQRVPQAAMQDIVTRLCHGHYLGVRVLSALLGNTPADLTRRVLSPMVGTGLLKRAYSQINNPQQAYRSTTEPS
jgi:predicted HTH transcriptional regulator